MSITELNQLKVKIEEMRLAMNQLGMKNGLGEEEVIIASQKLDLVLNRYYQLLKESNPC